MVQTSYRNEVAVRLNKLFDLIRIAHKDLHIVTICQLLGIDDIYEFEKYTFIIPDDVDSTSIKNTSKKKFALNIKLLNFGSSTDNEVGHTTIKNKHYNPKDLIRPPKLQLLEELADIFGVSHEWLQKGQGSPFKCRYLTRDIKMEVLYPEACLDYRNVFPSLKYYFVLSNELDAAIILQLSKYRFIVVPRVWSLNADTVGRTGQKQIESMCYLLERLQMKQTLGKIVSQELFNDLVSGQVYPGVIEYGSYCDPENKYEIKSSYWQDDLTCNRKGVQEIYANWFKKAQECIAFVRNCDFAGGRRYEIPESDSKVIPKNLITDFASADSNISMQVFAKAPNDHG